MDAIPKFGQQMSPILSLSADLYQFLYTSAPNHQKHHLLCLLITAKLSYNDLPKLIIVYHGVCTRSK